MIPVNKMYCTIVRYCTFSIYIHVRNNKYKCCYFRFYFKTLADVMMTANVAWDDDTLTWPDSTMSCIAKYVIMHFRLGLTECMNVILLAFFAFLIMSVHHWFDFISVFIMLVVVVVVVVVDFFLLTY